MCCGAGLIVKGDARTRAARTITCRSWGHPPCAEDRRRQLIAEVIAGEPTLFVTLTSKRIPGQSPDDAARQLSKAWQDLKDRIGLEATRPVEKRGLPYGAAPPHGWFTDEHGRTPRKVQIAEKRLAHYNVFEATQLGWPHMHLTVRAIWISEQWLSAQMADLHGSPVVKVEKIDSAAQIAGYVAKYVGEAPHKFKGCKRYWKSRNWPTRPRKPGQFDAIPGRWEHHPNYSLDQFCRDWPLNGWTVERVGWQGAIARAPPSNPGEAQPLVDLEQHVTQEAREVEQREAMARAWRDARAKFRN